MSSKVTDSSIVRESSTYEEYDVLQLDEDNNRILVSPIDSEEDENGILPGFWCDIEDFEVKVCRQHGSGFGVYNTFESISGFPERF